MDYPSSALSEGNDEACMLTISRKVNKLIIFFRRQGLWLHKPSFLVDGGDTTALGNSRVSLYNLCGERTHIISGYQGAFFLKLNRKGSAGMRADG